MPPYVVTPGPSHLVKVPVGSVHTHTRAGGAFKKPEGAARYATDLGYVSSAGVHTLRISTPSVEIDISADLLPGMQIAGYPGPATHPKMSFPLNAYMMRIDHTHHQLSLTTKPGLCKTPGCDLIPTAEETLEVERELITRERKRYRDLLEEEAEA